MKKLVRNILIVCVIILLAIIAAFSFLIYRGATVAVPASNKVPTIIRHDGATGKCKDGYYTYSTHTEGTCSSHGGIEEWYIDPSTGEPSTPKSQSIVQPIIQPTTESPTQTNPTETPTPVITPPTKTCAINIGTISVLCK